MTWYILETQLEIKNINHQPLPQNYAQILSLRHPVIYHTHHSLFLLFCMCWCICPLSSIRMQTLQGDHDFSAMLLYIF